MSGPSKEKSEDPKSHDKGQIHFHQISIIFLFGQPIFFFFNSDLEARQRPDNKKHVEEVIKHYSIHRKNPYRLDPRPELSVRTNIDEISKTNIPSPENDSK